MDESSYQSEDESVGDVAKWVSEIKLYEKESAGWVERSKKIVRRYKDERSPRELKARYNSLWANVQTLLPAVYDRPPTPNIERRFKIKDNLSRITSEILERCTSYLVKTETFDSVMEQVVLDRLLCGRGVAWVRYIPHFKDVSIQGNEEVMGEGVQITDDVYSEVNQEVDREEACVDYIHWQDFGHTFARTWEEVRACWKVVFLTRQELVERFGEEIGKAIPLDYSPEKLNDAKINDNLKKASVYEIWDKPSKTVTWIHKDYPRPLDKRDDPLGLINFFPFPKPLFSTLANDTIIPTPDYTEYQDQALELDELTARIKSIVKSIKVAGVYDGSAEGVHRLLAEGLENTLIAVDQYAVLAEKGGMKGVIDLLPMKEILETLLGLYQAREKVKQDMYEITGISDIIRGATNPNETLGAQQLKGQYANLRLGKMQHKAQVFSKVLVHIITEIVANHFSLDTIKDMSGIYLLTNAEKQMITSQRSLMEQQGQQPPILNDDAQEALQNPTWEEVFQFLKNTQLRSFQIDIETDSTIKADQDKEQMARSQFLQSVGGFLQQAVSAPPTMMPLLMQMLEFGVRGFKTGRELEGAFDVAKRNVEKMSQQPPSPPQPDPRIQIEQAKIQSEDANAKADRQLELLKLNFEREKTASDMAMKHHSTIMQGGNTDIQRLSDEVNGMRQDMTTVVQLLKGIMGV